METRGIPPKRLLTILFLAVIGCAFAFALVVAGDMYWVAALRANPQPQVQLPDRPPPRQFASARTEATQAIQTPQTFRKNAILADKNLPTAAGDDIFTELFIPAIQISLESSDYKKLKNDPREYV